MAGKNLLSDTDYTRGHDNRFGAVALIGKVSEIVCNEEGANVRVILPDKVDHQDQPLITKPIPVWQVSAGKKRSFAMPRLGQNCVLVKLPNATSDYLLLGTFYTKNDPPPVTDPKLDYTEWEGGHKQTIDANDDADVFLKQEFQGGWTATIKKAVSLKTTDGAAFSIEGDGDVLLKSTNANVNVESPNGTITLNQQTIHLQGSNEITIQAPTINLIGHVVVNGNMTETGFHTDSRGPHAATVELEEKVAQLEARVAELERRNA